MFKIKLLLIGLSIGMFFSSCGAKKNSNKTKTPTKETKSVINSEKNTDLSESKKVVTNTSLKKSQTTVEYIDNFSAIAVAQMREHKIPASITIAQGILESNSGNSGLTKKSNNHFGIKCHKNWNGGRTYYDDDAKGECFRVYKDPKNSYNDHSRFLTDRKRYANLFKLDQADYIGWANGLSKAGYATDKRYPQKLINIIRKYELYKYDEIVLGKKTNIQNYNIDSYIVIKGDGLYSISKKFNISIDELKALNNLNNDTIFVGQKLRVKPIDNNVATAVVAIKKDTVPNLKPIDSIKPKKDIATLNYHIVQSGETLYQIAYEYELEIPVIRKWNMIKKDEIQVGQKIWIQKPQTTNDVKSIESIESITNDRIHIVVKGDTLYSIATKSGISVTKLKSLNNLNSTTINVGQELIIK